MATWIWGTEIQKLCKVCVNVTFATKNRGDCEIRIEGAGRLIERLGYIASLLRASHVLETLLISLNNETQVKRGPKLLRSQEVKDTMKMALLPLASLKDDTSIAVTGFDTIEYAEMFDELRRFYGGRELPLGQMMDKAIHDA